jgi:hypothetical protein
MGDLIQGREQLAAAMGSGRGIEDGMRLCGVYSAVFRNRRGQVFHKEEFPNTLAAVGKAFLMDTALTSGVTSVANYMGLIGALPSYSLPLAADTMASHAEWYECGSTYAPSYSGTRNQCAWSASTLASPAATKSLTAGLLFSFTATSGYVNGAFIVGGTGAVSTLMSTVGILFSAGALGTAQPVVNGNTLTLSYSVTLN